MANIINIPTSYFGKTYQFVDDVIGSGAVKDVYFSPDRAYAVAFFRDKQDDNSKERLKLLVDKYRLSIFEQAGGEYWKNLYCWPFDLVENNGKTGIILPIYPKHFFFQYGSKNNDILNIKGREKEGKWFASANLRNKYLDDREKGNLLSYLRICILISRAVKRLHATGLAHSDLSYKNVLIDPQGKNVNIIDIDGLVVPGKFPPEVLGTPDFIAPEVMATKHLAMQDKNRKLPSIETDKHALSVLIYMYLLYRHPLRGGKVHDQVPEKDEELSMGLNALFIEHPTDLSNRPKLKQVKPSELPWIDVDKIPYKILGSYLKPLFERAFITGLHNPVDRPIANEWETALVKTIDLIQPCQNKKCEQGWFVFDNSTKPKCPYCGTEYKGQLPVLDFYSMKPNKAFGLDNHRLMVYSDQWLYQWHVYKNVFPDEKISDEQKKPVGYFVFHNGKWVFVNTLLAHLKDVTDSGNHIDIPINSMVEITNGKKLLLAPPDQGGRLVIVQMVNN
jgi:serine/threonine protein kinase